MGRALAGAALAALAVMVACGGSEATHETPVPRVTIRPGSPAFGGSTPSPAPVSGGFEYTVEPGDTLSVLADRFGTTVEEIVAANGLADPGDITAGDVLVIANASYAPSPSPGPTAAPVNPAGAGFAYPIEGVCLPSDGNLMPNAPREYRNGVHEGVDFYTGAACVDVPAGTPVLSAKAGEVVRADAGFIEMSLDELNDMLARSEAQGYTDAKALDRFRGRQVWIDHGGGIVTRYCHLSGIADGVQAGAAVQAGDVIGYVGESGTPEAVTDPGIEMHLHFEVRVGDSFLGAGLPPDQVRFLYAQAFSSP